MSTTAKRRRCEAPAPAPAPAPALCLPAHVITHTILPYLPCREAWLLQSRALRSVLCPASASWYWDRLSDGVTAFLKGALPPAEFALVWELLTVHGAYLAGSTP